MRPSLPFRRARMGQPQRGSPHKLGLLLRMCAEGHSLKAANVAKGQALARNLQGGEFKWYSKREL